MSDGTTGLLNPQDCTVCRTVLSFLSTPLVLLLSAATVIAI